MATTAERLFWMMSGIQNDSNSWISRDLSHTSWLDCLQFVTDILVSKASVLSPNNYLMQQNIFNACFIIKVAKEKNRDNKKNYIFGSNEKK